VNIVLNGLRLMRLAHLLHVQSSAGQGLKFVSAGAWYPCQVDEHRRRQPHCRTRNFSKQQFRSGEGSLDGLLARFFFSDGGVIARLLGFAGVAYAAAGIAATRVFLFLVWFVWHWSNMFSEERTGGA